jgi:hypothetical protein
MHDVHIAAVNLASFDSDGLKINFAQNAVSRNFLQISCRIETEFNSGWTS